MTNRDLSLKVFEFLKQTGTQIVVVCAGARNAPLVVALQEVGFSIIPFFEERSAGFFALGLVKAHGKPVAVMTTSGTAVAELLPAAIEATYQGLPLILISADRPRAYRSSGAPQSIQQVGIFSSYAETVYDLDVATTDFLFQWSFKKPIHLNICFDEPLMDTASAEGQKLKVGVQRTKISASMSGAIPIKNPVVIVGELNEDAVGAVQDFLIRTGLPVYAESLSQLNRRPELQRQMIVSSDHLIKSFLKKKNFETVIRIGGVPTLRLWRDLEQEFAEVPVFNFSDLEYSGLARPSQVFSIQSLEEVQVLPSVSPLPIIRGRDEELQKAKQSLIQKFPFSEPACVFRFSELIGDEPVYLGNSLPIRHWDAFTRRRSKAIYANRGANGIDGQISTYLGWAEAHSRSNCLIGDLTALYDLVALGLTPVLNAQHRVVILNNFGGQIFKRVFNNELFINPHRTQFHSWAQMWDWNYLCIKRVEDFDLLARDQSAHIVVEIQPDADQTQQFWKEWDELCQKM